MFDRERPTEDEESVEPTGLADDQPGWDDEEDGGRPDRNT